jgi:hypothetical protein
MFKDVTDAASMNIKFTQWSYHKHDMSPALSSATGKLIFMFQNWGQHYATVFIPQLWRTLLTGESPITNAMGKKYRLTDPERYALLSHLSLMAGIYIIGNQLGFNMDWIAPAGQLPVGKIAGQTVPFSVSPPLSLWANIGLATAGAISGKEEWVKRAWDGIVNYDLPAHVPMGVQARKMYRISQGEIPPESVVIPVKQNTTTYGGGRERGGRSR